MGPIAGILIWIGAGAALTVPWWWFCVYTQDRYYSLSKDVPGFMVERSGCLVLLLVMASGTLGMGIVLSTCGRVLSMVGLPIERVFFEYFAIGLVPLGGFYYLVGRQKQRAFLRRWEEGSPRCSECGYILRGLKPEGMIIRCPGCDKREHVLDIKRRLEHERRTVEAAKEHLL